METQDEIETLVRRLVDNPHDQAAITQAHRSGQSDPRIEDLGHSSTAAYEEHSLATSTATGGDASTVRARSEERRDSPASCQAPLGVEDPDENRVQVRMVVPAAVRAVFDEGLDLHRAVSGEEASVESFVEALVAEALSGHHSPDLDEIEVRHLLPGQRAAALEEALARTTDRWRSLTANDPIQDAADDAESIEALLGASETTKRFQAVSDAAGTGDAAALDGQIRTLMTLEDEIERRLGQLLAEMGDAGAWSRMLFAGAGHFGEERLGLSRTSAEDRAGLCRALRRLPAVREAYENGRIGFEAALLIRRVLDRRAATAGEEEAWVARAQEVTVKRLRDEVRLLGRTLAAEPLESPLAPPDDAGWQNSIRRGPGTAIARVAPLGKVAAEGRSPDVFLRLRLPEALAEDFLACVEARRRELAELVDGLVGEGVVIDRTATGSALAARTFSSRSGRVPAWVGLLALIEDYVATWDDPRQAPRRAADAVYIRDGWRCTAPGCTSRRNLEEHHLIYRSRGGTDDLRNRTCLCRLHHQLGEHGGLASCRGEAPLGIVWRLGRDALGGWYRNERRLSG